MGITADIVIIVVAALEIVRQALLHLDMPVFAIQLFTDGVRSGLYGPLDRQHADASFLQRFWRATRSMEIEGIPLQKSCPLFGKSATQAGIRRQAGASIVTVRNGDAVSANPDPDRIFQEGDILAVPGSVERRTNFRSLMSVSESDPTGS